MKLRTNLQDLKCLKYLLLLCTMHAINAQVYDSLLYEKLVEQTESKKENLILDLNFYYGIYGRDRLEFNREKDGLKLESIVYFLENHKSYRIKIGIHSDCRGSEEYNQAVTEYKAKMLKDEILYRVGTERNKLISERIELIGYGESMPISSCDCKNCDEEQFRINNRIEIEVALVFSNTLDSIDQDSMQIKAIEEGIVVLNIEVNEFGDVVKVEVDKLKTTIKKEKLIKSAISNAFEYKFEPSIRRKQSGTLIYKFKLVDETIPH